MKRFVFLSFILMTMISAFGIAALAQDISKHFDVFEQQFKKCIKHQSCTTQDKLRLLNEMAERMQIVLHHLSQACAKMNYKNCFSSSVDDLLRWHKIDDDMREMVRGMESEKAAESPQTGKPLNEIEPAAGPAPVPVPRPNRYTNPDQEQDQQDKKDWWKQGWAPPDEANPYYKW